MAVEYIVKVSAQGAEKIDQLEQGLDDVSVSAAKTTAALKGMGEGAAQGMAKADDALEAYRRSLDEKWAAINAKKLDDDNLKRINAPMEEFRNQLASLDRLLAADRISMERYDVELSKLNRELDKSQPKLSEELDREAKILEKINGPMREYTAQVAALDSLLKKGEIDLESYNRELTKAQQGAAKGLGPVQGPKQQGAAPSGGGGGGSGDGAGLSDALRAVAPQLGRGGQILGQFASGGMIAVAATAALVTELIHLGDEYTALASKVERFTTDSLSADDILHQQADLSRELHSRLAETEGLYVRIRESTTELNLSQREQLGLAHDIGVEVASEGKSAESAAALTRRLSLAFESGAISGRELRSIMKEYPEIADGFSAALGKSRNELLQMANKGEISAQQIIDAFHRMAPAAEKTLGRMHETFTQKAGHLWDELNLSVGGAVDSLMRLDDSPAQKAAEDQERHLHAMREAARQLNVELEKNIKTTELAAAAKRVGVDIGPFDKEAADSITRARMTAREAGIDIADAFAGAKDKAKLYGAEIDKIKEQHAAKDIADDAKRMYDAMYGADDILKKQIDKWRDVGQQIATITKAIERWRVLDAGGATSRERTELERQKRDLLTEQDNQPFGDDVTKFRQGLDKARDGLQDWSAAAKAGTISDEELRKKTDEFLTTLNDGRLPEAIKIWEGIHLPIDQAARDMAALNALFKSGRLDVDEYVVELKKIANTHLNGNAAILAESIEVLDKRLSDGVYDLRAHDDAVRKLTASYAELHKTASGITYRVAPIAQAGRGGLLPNTEQGGYAPSATDGAEMRKILAQAQSSSLVPGTGDNAALLNQQMERARDLALESVAPAVKYEQTIEDITVAQETWGLSEEHASVRRRRAKVEWNAAEEALARIKGPQEAYDATLRKLNDQLINTEISQSKYTDAVARAKEQLLTDTGGDKTFFGALELQWIKLQQEADRLGATIAGQLVGNVDKLNDALVTAANGGAVSWSGMADSMIQDLERVALKMLELKLMSGLFGLFSGGGGVAGLADTGNSGGVDYAGYANGGSFMVGGQGGTDSKLLGIRVTPGEMVTVRTPGQQSDTGRAQQAVAQQAPVVHIHNHYDTSVAQAAMDSPGGQKSVINTLRVNPGAARSMTSRPRRA